MYDINFHAHVQLWAEGDGSGSDAACVNIGLVVQTFLIDSRGCVFI